MKIVLAALITTTVFTSALAEQSFSLYGGMQEAADGTAEVVDVDGSKYELDLSWEGKSFDNPKYYGIRYTNFVSDDWGYAVDFVHSKVYSTDETRANAGYKVLEFTDGINVLTLNGVRRFDAIGGFRPYVGAGLGISEPHVELWSPAMSKSTFEYQFGGLAATTFAGASYAISDHWSVFGEAKFDYSMIDVKMDTGTFKTDVLTQAFNMGLSYSF